MAIAMQYIITMEQMDLLHGRIIDVGCSNLYSAQVGDITGLLDRHGVDDKDFAADLAERSARKTAFAGELFDKIGCDYQAIDLAVDYKTLKFDLNKDRLKRKWRGAFDLVLNFGTTEHVIGQANAFEVIHQAAKAGGHIFHQVPAAGFFGHGYFSYTTRFFGDLAGYNGYDVSKLWFDQASDSRLSDPVRDYAAHFPVLHETVAPQTDVMPDTALNVIYRKVQNKQFKWPLEMSTAYSG